MAPSAEQETLLICVQTSIWLVQVSPPSAEGSWYVIVRQPEKGAAVGAFAGLEALHRYYDANKAALIQKYAQDQAERVAAAEWRAAHPQARPDTLIRYWPKKSALHLPDAAASHEEAAP